MLLDGHVRVSQVGDRAGQSFISPIAQREYIERWASRHGVSVGVVFEELNWLGGRADRPQWRECIARVERGEFK